NIAQNNFAEGNQVKYLANGNTPITGLTDGATYTVHVIDADNFQLKDNSGNIIAISFLQGQALSQGAALGVQTLSNLTQAANLPQASNPAWTSWTIYPASIDTANNAIVMQIPAALQTNPPPTVAYNSLEPDGTTIGALTVGNFYTVKVIGANKIQ